jgi:octaprenyl-diphosphate synthase
VDVKSISTPIREELKIFEEHFRDAMKSKVGLVSTIARYIVRQKGKRVRPALVLLSAATCGVINKRTYRAASLVELLHTATLVHDDVVDEASTRRGLASINAIWKNKVAVLMGDYLLARGLLLSVESNDFEFLRITSSAVKRMSEGELLQIQKSRKLDIDEETYFRIISDKTASLLSTCCEMGAASTTDNPEYLRRMKDFGENIGIAFQIQDDLFDYLGSASTIGKPIGIDMQEKKMTLPLIYSFKEAPKSESREIMRLVKNGVKRKDIGEIVEFVKGYGGFSYAETKAKEFTQRAQENISIFPDSPARESLMKFTEFVTERVK